LNLFAFVDFKLVSRFMSESLFLSDQQAIACSNTKGQTYHMWRIVQILGD